MFDLHFHSILSDGEAPLSTIAAVLRSRPDLALAALADHDRVDGSAEIARLDRRAWVAAEILTASDGCKVDILALNVDPSDKRLNSYLSERAAERAARLALFGDLLRRDGWAFDPALAPREQPTNSHVAAELRRRADNHARLAALGVPLAVADRKARDLIYPLLLDGYGRRISDAVSSAVAASPEAVAMIRAAGGLAVVAHPWVQPYGRGSATKTKARRILDSLVAAGLDGIELWHPQQSDPAVSAELRAYAESRGLLLTAGSDDHTPDAGFVGTVLPPAAEAPALLERILRAAADRRR